MLSWETILEHLYFHPVLSRSGKLYQDLFPNRTEDNPNRPTATRGWSDLGCSTAQRSHSNIRQRWVRGLSSAEQLSCCTRHMPPHGQGGEAGLVCTSLGIRRKDALKLKPLRYYPAVSLGLLCSKRGVLSWILVDSGLACCLPRCLGKTSTLFPLYLN